MTASIRSSLDARSSRSNSIRSGVGFMPRFLRDTRTASPKQLSKSLEQGITQHQLHRPRGLLGRTTMSASRGLSQDNPVRGAIATAAVTRRLYECLDKVDRMVIRAFPVFGESSQHAAEYVRCQVRHPDPRRNQEST